MDATRTYDIIIIGTGAGGGAVLHTLAQTGKKILVLERGGYLPREKDNWNSRSVFVDNKYKAREQWFAKDGTTFKPEIHYYVGGNTKLYGAALLRFQPRDFDEIHHFGGVSPAWPISYTDMAPYYSRAERLYRVHGQRGMDPLESPSMEPFPHPAVKHEPRIQQLHDDLCKLGCSPFPLPTGLILDEQNPDDSPCIRCSTCDGFPCLLRAKADAEVLCVRPALANSNVTLLTNAFVERLETDSSGREVKRVIVRRDGAQEEFGAGMVVVSCGAINSAALLLRSSNEAHPSGLANRSDMVGRNYMCHNNSAYVAISPEPNPTVFQKTLAMNDFYFNSDDWDFPMGHIQTMGKADAGKFHAAAPFPLPHIALHQLAHHSLDFWVTSEDLPDPENRVMVRRDGTIELRHAENNLEAHNRLNAKLTSMLHKIDRMNHGLPWSLCLRKKIPLRGTTHQCGTVRFGRDPQNSVLDVNCRAHDVHNLYVVDSSCFVSSAAMNPALTVVANALRVADHLKDVVQ